MPQYSLYDSAQASRGEQPRVRERLAKDGPSALSNADLLAVILAKKYKQLSGMSN